MLGNEYVTIQSWMRTELELSGNELLVYAVIYGFSQDGVSRFSGSRQYLADWCGCTVRSVQSVLNNLVAKELITKYEHTVNGIKLCEYVVNFISSEKISLPSEKISLNNTLLSNDNSNSTTSSTIEPNIIKDNTDNIGDFSSHAYSPEELKEDFLGSAKAVQKKKRKNNLFDKCSNKIYEYTDDADLQEALFSYLKIRLAIKEKPIYGVQQWQSLLNKLDKIKGNKVDIVNQSAEKGWCSFYEITSFSKKDTLSEGDGLNCASAEDTETERADKLKKQGRRVSF